MPHSPPRIGDTKMRYALRIFKQKKKTLKTQVLCGNSIVLVLTSLYCELRDTYLSDKSTGYFPK